jgi:hypothetical protein
MNKYTVIYLKGFQCGSHSSYLPFKCQIECKKEEIEGELLKRDIDIGEVSHIFAGWPEEIDY